MGVHSFSYIKLYKNVITSCKKTCCKEGCKPAVHPTYAAMCKAAIAALAGRKGASRQAVQKYIAATFKETKSLNVNKALKAGVTKGDFVPLKGCYKLKKEEPKKKPKKPKSPKKKAAPKKKKSRAQKEGLPKEESR